MVTTAKVAVSGRPQQRNVDVIKDGEIPSASNDHASYFDWYPARGNKETVDYTFAKPAKVGECGLYWFDDTGQGSVRVPASWRLLYKDGDEWRPVETQEQFGVVERSVQHREVHAGDHHRAARGIAGATQLLGWNAEVDG